MNLETVITKQQGIEAMQYVIANVSDDSFMDHVAHYLYDHYKSGFLGTSPVPEGISTMIDIWIGPEGRTIKAQPAFILTDKERTSIGHQFYRTLEESKLIHNFFEYEMNKNNQVYMTLFQTKDLLKPLDEYIAEIKDSNVYKQYRFNYLVETYDLSISHLKRLEYELFADDSSYVSNIDNLIYAALDNIADDFKMNVINYIEDNYLQEKTGINCISDIPVIIKDGEFQGIFKEFESYGLNDFSVQNITMFIDRFKEIMDYLNSIEITSCLNPTYVKNDVYGLIIALLAERNSLKLQLKESHEQTTN